MSSKRDTKRIKKKPQQNYLSPVSKKKANQFDFNLMNLRDLSPFRPVYGSHATTNYVHLSNTELTIIQTPANTIPREQYLEQIQQGLHSISMILNWEQDNQDSQENSQIIQMSEDESSKSAQIEGQGKPQNYYQKDSQANLKMLDIKLKKDSLKKNSQSINSSSNNKKVSCNCKKTKCLKLYCDCFRINQTCDGCNCVGCHNLPIYQQERNNSMLTLMDRNPQAFRPKIEEEQHSKGCHCRKSYCQKKYCECYQAGLKCGSNCKCEECKNRQEQEPDRNDGNSNMNSLIVNIQNLMANENIKKQVQKIPKMTSYKKQKIIN